MIRKKYIYLALSILLGFLIYQTISFFALEEDKINAVYLVPRDAVFFMEMDEPLRNMNTLAQSEIWDHLQTNDDIHKMSAKLNAVDSLFQSETDLFEMIGDRDVIMSAHMIKRDDYAFLYIVDMQKLSQLNLLKNNINQLLSSNFTVTKRLHKDIEITEVTDKTTYETLSIAFVKNQMVASYTHSLVEKSIEEFAAPEIGRDLQFLEIQREVRQNDLFRFYLNHKYLSDYYKAFSNEESPFIKLLEDHFNFSGFQIDVDDDRLLLAQGYTNGDPTAQSLIKALHESGTGSIDAITVLPQETALYLSFGFDNFSTLHHNFYSLLGEQQPEMVADYEAGRKKIEGLLDIDLQHDFYDWMDDELAFAKADAPNLSEKEGLALAIKANDTDDARERLKFIEQQIRKKTPVKFKEVDYRGYKINYLEIKSFFKLIIGSLFENIEKPYYTIIDEYVIFSNSPKTLKLFIDGYEEKTSLIGNEYYRNFIDEFSSESNVFLYIDTNKLSNASGKYLNQNSRKELKKNEVFYSQFTQLGLELKARENFFESKAVIHYDRDYDHEAIQLEERNKNEPLDLVTIKKEEISKETIFDIAPIFPDDFTANFYEQRFNNGKLKMKVYLKDGIPDGRYKEYYFDGQLKISGRYDEGKQDGTWKAYLRNGKRFHKEKF
ncbi:DUF3352 domain-containing protein [uncultured Nonlabens sp.]|uniref:DUF3352 domain-containing protein n=1 Tax=uncultured Nonlabens sp. TaxID=859306 RepID=UPI002612ECF3|nr:DUF3352 domain-containing protein [uncultured Nonlabens sp.]